MKTNKNSSQTKSLALQTLHNMALATATAAANSRCAYIYHNPKKPDGLKQLKKF